MFASGAGRRKRAATRRVAATDVILAALATVIGLVILGFGVDEGSGTVSAVGYAAVPVAGLAVAARRHQPVVALVIVAVARVVVAVDNGSEFAIAAAMAVVMYTVGRNGDRRAAAWAAGAVALASGAAIALLGDEAFLLEWMGETAQFLLPAVIGDAVRTRNERTAERIETEAEARVQAERLRIARDLHDVVAHGLSTISVQSGVAAHLLDRDPDGARASLEAINQIGKTSLEELRTMVGVLRSTNDDPPLRPAPTADDAFAELLAGAEASGLTIVDRTSGHFPPDVSDAVIVAVHRIVQEALTNTIRHAGSVTTTVAVERGERSVSLSVGNEAGARGESGGRTAVPSTGVGIIGMRERAESLGGTFSAGPTGDGGFLVTASIPYRGQTP
ncbi:MAG: sensor histidine kinase [Actinomycetota bacterium]